MWDQHFIEFYNHNDLLIEANQIWSLDGSHGPLWMSLIVRKWRKFHNWKLLRKKCILVSPSHAGNFFLYQAAHLFSRHKRNAQIMIPRGFSDNIAWSASSSSCRCTEQTYGRNLCLSSSLIFDIPLNSIANFMLMNPYEFMNHENVKFCCVTSQRWRHIWRKMAPTKAASVFFKNWNVKNLLKM